MWYDPGGPPPYDPGWEYDPPPYNPEWGADSAPGAVPPTDLSGADISGLFNQPQQVVQLPGAMPPRLIGQNSVSMASQSTVESFNGPPALPLSLSSFAVDTSASASFDGAACCLCLSAPRYLSHCRPLRPPFHSMPRLVTLKHNRCGFQEH